MLSSNAKYQGSCLTHPYVAPHTSKIHTLITLGIRHRNNPLVSKAWQRLPRGFDSHRPLHFQPSLANASQLDLRLTASGMLVNIGRWWVHTQSCEAT